MILPGSDLDASIAEHLESAKIILLLVSPDFIASDYCYATELERAIERHKTGTARVIPIIARPCDWTSLPFGKLKALPQDGKPVTGWKRQDDAYTNIAKNLRTTINEMQKILPKEIVSEKLIAPQESDDVKISCEFFSDRSDSAFQKFGTPCLTARLTCRGRRPAKIAKVKLHVRGPHILSAIQKAFSTDFGYGPDKAHYIDEPSFTLTFFAASDRNATHGHVIEEADRLDFSFPSDRGIFLGFAEAPPTDIFFTVQYLNGEVKRLTEGITVQSHLPDLVRWNLDSPSRLHPMLTLEVGMDIKATKVPDLPIVDFLNDEQFVLPVHPRRDIPVDSVSDLVRFRAKVLRAGCEKDLSSEKWLIDVVRHHADLDVRRDAIVSLRMLLTPGARDFFAQQLSTETNEFTRELIIRSFALVGIPDDIPVMERLVKGESSRFCKHAASFALKVLQHRFSGNDKIASFVANRSRMPEQSVKMPNTTPETNSDNAASTEQSSENFKSYNSEIIQGIRWTWSWKNSCSYPHIDNVENLELWCSACGKRIEPTERTSYVREAFGGRNLFGSETRFGEHHYHKPQSNCDLVCDDGCTKLTCPASVSELFNRVRRHIEHRARGIASRLPPNGDG